MKTFGFKSLELKTSLPNDIQQEYLRRYKNGESSLRNVIVEHNLRLVSSLAFSYYNGGLNDLDDIFEVGVIGLLKAIDSYDPDNEKGALFSTYAYKCIVNAINMFIRKNAKDTNKCFTFDFMLANKNDKGDESDFEGDYEEKKTYFVDELVDEKADFQEKIIKDSAYSEIRKIVNELQDSRNKEIVMKYYGFDCSPRPQHEIASEYGIAQSQVCRIVRNVTSTIALMLEKRDVIELSNKEIKRLKIKGGK